MDTRSPRWTEVKQELNSWGQRELLGLVKELFAQSAENRSFLAARLLRESLGDEILEPYRKRIFGAFYSRTGWPRANLGLWDARKAIRDYRKATSDINGSLDLMLTYVEIGTGFALEFGDLGEACYNSLCSALEEFKSTLQNDQDSKLYGQFSQRLFDLADKAKDLGWGYGDRVVEAVSSSSKRHSA